MSPGTSNFWKENLHQELATLHLPGPSVIIDVRQGSDLDPPLIWNLAVELEDLAREMQLKHVFRWHHLTEFIDLMKITPLRFDEPLEDSTDFTITTSTGQHKTLIGLNALMDELGRHHIDRVRNNRISAVRDRNTGVEDTTFFTTPEQITVRVFFIVDAEDRDSLASAATYALWLKKWYHEYDTLEYSGRDRRISTLAICMNVDPHRHHPSMLARFLDQTSRAKPALEAVIIMQVYSDDEAFIGSESQSYQIETLLYVLLLISEENLVNTDRLSSEHLQLSSDLDGDNTPTQPEGIPWSVTLIGISSLEYSARWAARWLDYGLVTRIIEIMQDKEEVQQEDLQGLLRREVHQQLQTWQDEVSQVISDTFMEAVPELQALPTFQHLLANPPVQGNMDSLLQDFDLFTQSVRQLYTEDEITLQSAVDYASLSVLQLKKAYDQKTGASEETIAQEVYQQLMHLKDLAQQLPKNLFHGTRGMLPRALLQMQILEERIAKIQDHLQETPDLLTLRRRFEYEAHQVRQQLERLPRTSRWKGVFTRKSQEQREKILRRLCAIASTHLDQVRAVILTKVMLALLKDAGLYHSKEVNSQYHQRIRRFEATVQKAYSAANQQQERAYERLKISLNKTQSSSTEQNWLNLNSRKDILSWEQIIEAFEQFYSHLASVPTSLNLLMQWTLQLMATENPLLITKEYISKINDLQGPLTVDQAAKLQMHASNTVIVSVLLLLEIVNFDIVALQPLLTHYIDLKERSAAEPSALENNILSLQNLLKEAMLERATRNKQPGKPATSFGLKGDLPIERIIAAWVSNQYTEDPRLTHIFANNDVLLHLAKQHVTPAQILDDLRMRNRVAGYREMMMGEDRFYLLTPPGESSQEFTRQDRDLLYATQIRQIRFPDREKLLYLHIHQVHYIIPAPSLSEQTTTKRNQRAAITKQSGHVAPDRERFGGLLNEYD